MTVWLMILALASQCMLATGQVLLKQAVMAGGTPAQRRLGRGWLFTLAIGCMTVYFFVWLGMLRLVALSQLAPFDALGPLILVGLAYVVFRERLTARTWLGVGLILAGVATIALS